MAEARSDSVEVGVARERLRVFIEAHQDQESRLKVILEALAVSCIRVNAGSYTDGGR
jgi:hypothetical protein